jgi:signal transduction histidine kinase
MNYRAKMINGSLSVQSTLSGGTMVRCMFPIGDRSQEVSHAS